MSATIGDLLTFPVLRQLVLNRIDDIATLGVGLGQSGAAFVAALGTIPEMLGTAIGQVLQGDLVGAFNTITLALRDATVAVVEPTLAAIIERRTRSLEVATALQTAVPVALVQWVCDTNVGEVG